VGLLADSAADSTATAPLPGVRDLEQLAADYHGAGLDIHLSSGGDPACLPAGVSLAVYRIAQEALANAAEHAPGARVDVDVDVDVDVRSGSAVRLRVVNTAARPGAIGVHSEGGSGLGLVGMRQRAELLGGSFAAGPSGDGWLVECSIPLPAGESDQAG
jgi:signal transduction histidine kinase